MQQILILINQMFIKHSINYLMCNEVTNNETEDEKYLLLTFATILKLIFCLSLYYQHNGEGHTSQIESGALQENKKR